MDASDRKNRDQSELTADVIDRIRQLRRQGLSIPQIAARIGWPEGRSMAALRRMAGELPKSAIHEAAPCDEVARRHVGCLYGGRW